MPEATQLKSVDRLAAPAAGVAKREAIKSLVDNMSTDLAGQIKRVHMTAERLEQGMLSSAAHAKSILDAHVADCQSIGEELDRLESTLNRIAEHPENTG